MPTTVTHTSWSKYGGKRYGTDTTVGDMWACQFCGKKQSRDMARWLIKFDDNHDVFRICSVCRFAYVNVVRRKVYAQLYELIKDIRRFQQSIR